jgi:hypothetical protein
MKRLLLISLILLSACEGDGGAEGNLEQASIEKRIESENLNIGCFLGNSETYISFQKSRRNKADIIYKDKLYENIRLAWTPSEIIFSLKYRDSSGLPATWTPKFTINRDTLYMELRSSFIDADGYKRDGNRWSISSWRCKFVNNF